MERLTYRLNDQFDNPTDSIILMPYLRYEDPETRKKILNRLAAYEETDMEPEEIADFMKRWEQTVEIGGMLKKYCIDHIRDLLQAEQDGRLVVLPCKVGDHVWVDSREAVVENFFGYETERYLHAQFYDNMQYIDIPFTEIGKTVFLTRQDAEALKGGEGL